MKAIFYMTKKNKKQQLLVVFLFGLAPFYLFLHILFLYLVHILVFTGSKVYRVNIFLYQKCF